MTTHPDPLPPIAKNFDALRRPPWGRTCNAVVILSTVALLAGSIGGYWYDRKQREALAAVYLHVVVTGPAALETGAPAEYSIAATNIAGEPLPCSIEWSLCSPEGKRLVEPKEVFEESGRLRVTIPADVALPSRVELAVAVVHGSQREEAKTTLAVRPTQYATQLTLDRPSYRPGNTVYYRALTLSRWGLAAGRAMPIHFEVLDPSGAVAAGSTLEALNDRGVGNGAFVIPKQARDGRYSLVARSMDGAFAQQRRSFTVGRESPPAPLDAAAKKVAVEFYPEGGELVEGLENRVYFTAHDLTGGAISVKGIVIDSRDDEVATAETGDSGRGSFSLLPVEGRSYWLEISEPKGIGQRFKLPPASSERTIVLNAGTGVFAAGKPLEFNIRAAKDGTPLAAVAWCRGVPVGVQTLATSLEGHDQGANSVSLPLDAEAGGVIGLAAYDYSSSPPQLVARRLVYRPMSRRLTVRAAEHLQAAASGGKAGLDLSVSDENGKAVPAVLGISIVGPVGARAAFPPGADLDGPADLDQAGLLHSDDKDAAEAIDLLLGTQTGAAAAEAETPPLVLDNLAALQAQYEKSLSHYRHTRGQVLAALVALGFFGGLGLLLLVTMLALLTIVSGPRLWLPTVAAAVCCALVGLRLMDSGRSKADGKVVPFTPFSLKVPAETAEQPAAAKEATVKGLKTFAPKRYAYQRGAALPGQKSAGAELLYWDPLAIAGPDGRVQVSFDLPPGIAAFDILAEASGDGRVGWAELRAEGGRRRAEGGRK